MKRRSTEEPESIFYRKPNAQAIIDETRAILDSQGINETNAFSMAEYVRNNVEKHGYSRDTCKSAFQIISENCCMQAIEKEVLTQDYFSGS